MSILCIPSVSNCKKVKAFLECVSTISQGEFKSINIQILNADNTFLDLSLIEEINIILFDDRNVVVGEFCWPFNSSYRDIYILQEENTEEILNMGLINIELDSSITSNVIAGKLYGEIKLSSNINTFGSNDIIISCLTLAKIKSSRIGRHLTEIELNSTNNYEENRVINGV